jgi:hypothetical protein
VVKYAWLKKFEIADNIDHSDSLSESQVLNGQKHLGQDNSTSGSNFTAPL